MPDSVELADLKRKLMTATSEMCRLVFRFFRTPNRSGHADMERLRKCVSSIEEAKRILQDDVPDSSPMPAYHTE